MVSNFWSNNYIEYKSKDDKSKTLSVEEVLNKIRPYLKYIINDLKKFGTWKIQLTITINFISSKDDDDEENVMHSKSDEIETIIDYEADEIIKELFDSFKNRYQNRLEESMNSSDFVFDYVHLLCYKCKINPNCGESQIGKDS